MMWSRLTTLALPCAITALLGLVSSETSGFSPVRLPIPAIQYPTCEAPKSVERPSKVIDLENAAAAVSEKARFLSFEDWKAQNLAQDAAIHQSSTRESESELQRTLATSIVVEADSNQRTRTISAGDFVSDRRTGSLPQHDGRKEGKPVEQEGRHDRKNFKNERFNHASFDCAASVLQSNAESKGSSNILKENKDYYMLNTCGAASKFVVIELCNDILVDNLQLANFEYFSGVFKDVRVLIASKYPPGRDGWHVLGNLKARHVREIQSFAFENPLIWARYIKIEMLSFYGNEFYCPLSLIRVFGKTMMEDYKQEGAPETGDALNEDSHQVDDLARVETAGSVVESIATEVTSSSIQETEDKKQEMNLNSIAPNLMKPAGTALNAAVEILHTAISTIVSSATTTKPPEAARATGGEARRNPTCAAIVRPLSYPTSVPELNFSNPTRQMPRNKSSTSQEPSTVRPSSNGVNASSISTVRDRENVNLSASISSQDHTNRSTDGQVHSSVDTRTHLPRTPLLPTQESIYKQITKRLSLLEANATLSLKYIESQSALLAHSFSQLSTNQARHLTSFLENINVTLLQRTAQLNQEYAQLYLDAMKSIESARHRQERDIAFVSRRVGLLGDDITFFKRLGIFQAFLLIVLIGFLIMSKGSRVETQVHRVLSTADSPWPLSPRARSPRLWRDHFRAESGDAGSMYSFPVGQIDRPDRSIPATARNSPNLNGNGDGLGIRGVYSDGKTPHTEPISRIRSPLISRPSNTRTKDDMFDGDLNSAIRRRLYRDDSWSSAREEPQTNGSPISRDQTIDNHAWNGDDTGASDYPTPREEDDEVVEPSPQLPPSPTMELFAANKQVEQ